MSNPKILIPISDEQAKAIQEALKTLQGFGGFLRETFGTVPQDVAGLLGGDWLKVRRAENLARTASLSRAIGRPACSGTEYSRSDGA